MRYLVAVILFLQLDYLVYAQSDSSAVKSNRSVRFHLSNGVNVLQNEQLRLDYQNKALYFWGVGVRLSDPNPAKDLLFVAADYTFSSYHFTREVNKQSIDSLLRFQQFIPSISLQLFKIKEVSMRIRTGYIYCLLTDQAHHSEGALNGFKIGLSVERKLPGNQIIHIDLDYDLMKGQRTGFRDYDMVKLAVGIYL